MKFRSIATSLLSAMLVFFAAVTTHAQERTSAIIILDASNSMWGQIDGRPKIEIAREVMRRVVGNWAADAQLGLVVYGHRRRGDCGDIETVIPVGQVDAESFVATVEGIQPRGKTPLTDAISHAAEELGYREDPATIILLSDGIETCDRDPCAVAADLERRGVSFTAHVIGFDVREEGEQAQLQCIAEETGGRFFTASNADELDRAMGEAARETTEREEPEEEPEQQITANVTLTVPDSAQAGSTFDVSWTNAVHPRDYITIVPVEAEDSAYDNYFRVQDRETRSLQAPAEAGTYEVRYVLHEERRVVARARIEITEPSVTVSAPETAVAGSTVTVSWTNAVHPRDYITVVPAEAPDDAYDNYVRVQDHDSRPLQMPSEPGVYEVRYVLQEGRRVLARSRIEITEASITVSAPERAVAGSAVDVSWTNAVHPRDYITVVPADAPDDAYENYVRVQDQDSRPLQMPSEPGIYEVRYVLQEGRRVMARTRIEITEPEITLTAPGQVRVEAGFEVSWSGDPPNRRDYITIVPVGADDSEYGDYKRVSNGSPVTLTAPDQTGLYEVRYVLNEGRRVVARAQVEVVGENAAIDTGAGLQAPETAAAGSDIRVTWTMELSGGDHRITLARPDQADFTWLEAQTANDGPPLSFTAPDEAGVYEIRYLDLENRRVLGRVRVTVQ